MKCGMILYLKHKVLGHLRSCSLPIPIILPMSDKRLSSQAPSSPQVRTQRTDIPDWEDQNGEMIHNICTLISTMATWCWMKVLLGTFSPRNKNYLCYNSKIINLTKSFFCFFFHTLHTTCLLHSNQDSRCRDCYPNRRISLKISITSCWKLNNIYNYLNWKKKRELLH